MKLTLDDIKRITAGALEITEEGGTFTFCRFEQKAREYYENCGNAASASNREQARASASIL